jgi:hypothetical protein
MMRSVSLSVLLILILLLSACESVIPLQTQADLTDQGLPDYPDCDQAELVSETIPTGTRFQAGSKFEKTWVMRNASDCDWDDQYALVYYDGDGMGESTHLGITEKMVAGTVIRPGETVTITLVLRAPFKPGRQVGYWQLRDPAGMLFSPNNVSQDYLSVDIEVIDTVYSFADNLCQAEWKLNDQPIDCPVTDSGLSYMFYEEHFPSFEGGLVDNEPAISILLPKDEFSTITATFPALTIKRGDHLHLATACGNDCPQCDLTFAVAAITDGGTVPIGEWHELSDGIMQPVDQELSNLADKSVQFSFTLRSNGAIEGNRGLWFFPVLLPY